MTNRFEKKRERAKGDQNFFMVTILQLEVAKRGLFEKLNLNSVAKGLSLNLNGSVAIAFYFGKDSLLSLYQFLTQEYTFVPTNCQVNLKKCWGQGVEVKRCRTSFPVWWLVLGSQVLQTCKKPGT